VWLLRPAKRRKLGVTDALAYVRRMTVRPITIPAEAKERLRIMFIAKHAKWGGGLHPEDGNHALYHVEVRQILEEIGLNLVLADKYDALFSDPGVDFVFPLLNRGGFLNSEMMLPLLCTRLGIPYLGASPILRGLSDDKHLTKLCVVARGIPTAPWKIFRRGAPVTEVGAPMAERMVIKPNASSASWGVMDASDWSGVERAVTEIHDMGHDAIMEPFLNGSDVEVPVITVGGEPIVMPMMLFEQADPSHLRTYYEKRDLVERVQKYQLVDFENDRIQPIIDDLTRKLIGEFFPFDYGSYEFRVNLEKGDVQFLEVNLNCNLWSEKVFGRSAKRYGWTQKQLIETILAESLSRQGLI
jgi:D-alanine-D-alanine ligase